MGKRMCKLIMKLVANARLNIQSYVFQTIVITSKIVIITILSSSSYDIKISHFEIKKEA